MNYQNEKDFFCRTLHNLEIYREEKQKNPKAFEYEITQLINSFFGLIIFVKANAIQENPALEDFVEANVPTKWDYVYYGKQEDHNFFNYLRHIRNAIAHPTYDENLEIKSENNDISSIIFRDKDPKNPKNIFEANLTIKKIDELIELISKAFLGTDQCTPEGKIKN
ncbi:HEPN family nuclease [Sulfurospirillum sp. MES]|uniref:HEPN family nuclease n=1 Tax=Sulfurospirillum sp. MES TaxID=1565314 RepID=UPI00054404C8|nr:HEPN family nuclease [Sulfurospirillum sp. MES]KHG35111.1 MAG: hypothetical protein OA34_02935 [Sulfurospirillum sp. MES]